MERDSTGTQHRCPPPEALAAYVDGRLSWYEREHIESHFADCDECREVVADAVMLARTPVEGRFWTIGRSVAAGGAALALAASLILGIRIDSDWLARDPATPHAELVAAVGANRTVQARLTGGFQYAPFRSPGRSGETGRIRVDDYTLLGVAGKIQKRAAANATLENLHALGLAHLVVGEYDGAVTALESAVKQQPSAAMVQTDLAAAYMARAASAGRAADWPRAVETAETAVRLDPHLIEAWFNRALALEGFGLRERAASAWEEYLVRDDDSEWSEEARKRLNELRSPSSSRGASRLRDDFNDTLLPAWAAAHLAGNTGDADAALTRIRTAVTDAELARDRTELQIAEWLTSNAAAGGARADDAAHAVQCFKDVRSLYAAGNMDPLADRARECLAQGGVGTSPLGSSLRLHEAIGAYYKGDLSRAVVMTDAELAHLDVAAQPSLGARWLSLRGGFHYASGSYGAALERQRLALAAYSAAADDPGVASVHQFIAESLRALGETDAAWEHYGQALLRASVLGSDLRRHALWNSVGLAALTQGLPRLAIQMYEATLAPARTSRHAPRLAESLLNQARAYRAVQDPARARALLAEARSVLADVPEGPIRVRLSAELKASEAETLLDFDPAAARTAATSSLDLYAALNTRFRTATLHLIRARASLALGEGRIAEEEFRAGIEVVESERARLEERRLRVSHTDRVWDLYTGLVSRQIAGGLAEAALLTFDRFRGRTLAGSIRVAAKQEMRMRPGATALVFAILPEGIFRWVVNDDVRLDRVGDARALEHASAALSAAVHEANADAVEQALSAIGSIALTGLTPADLREHVVIVPDGVLHGVPFGALRLGPKRLVESHELTVSPTFSAVAGPAEGRTPRPRRDDSVWVLANPKHPSSALPPLPAAIGEAQDVAGRYLDAHVRRGADATGEQFTTALQQRAVVHFAGHAVANEHLPWAGYLALAASSSHPDGRVTVDELLGVRQPRAHTVVLAACSTAAGKMARGEGALSLSAALMAAGVPTVVATLWDIEDAAARRFYSELHAHLAAGKNAAAAVSLVQRAAAARGDSVLHWAAVTTVGA